MKTSIITFFILCMSLASCDSSKSTLKTTNKLEGTWQLNYISGVRIAFDGLYPNKKPTITFDLKENKVSGTNSCNQYFGTPIIDGNKINFKEAKMGMTMMACQGSGEHIYMETLEKIDSYSVSEDGKTLNFIMGDIAMMRFEKIIDIHNSKIALDWQGQYKGIIPCADCEGIETEIVLNNDLTYSIKTKYLGKGDGKVFEENGSFIWDKKGENILLGGKISSQYKVGENRLIQYDIEGNPITGSLAENYILKKQ